MAIARDRMMIEYHLLSFASCQIFFSSTDFLDNYRSMKDHVCPMNEYEAVALLCWCLVTIVSITWLIRAVTNESDDIDFLFSLTFLL